MKRTPGVSDPLHVVPAIGEDGVARLVAAFYRGVPDDPVLAPLYPEDDLAGAEDRLRSFLVYRLGGSPAYLTERGHPRLRLRHAPFAIGRRERDAWMARMDGALAECAFADDVASTLHAFFAHVATFLINAEPLRPRGGSEARAIDPHRHRADQEEREDRGSHVEA